MTSDNSDQSYRDVLEALKLNSRDHGLSDDSDTDNDI